VTRTAGYVGNSVGRALLGFVEGLVPDSGRQSKRKNSQFPIFNSLKQEISKIFKFL
jgi:hypothetical protein